MTGSSTTEENALIPSDGTWTQSLAKVLSISLQQRSTIPRKHGQWAGDATIAHVQSSGAQPRWVLCGALSSSLPSLLLFAQNRPLKLPSCLPPAPNFTVSSWFLKRYAGTALHTNLFPKAKFYEKWVKTISLHSCSCCKTAAYFIHTHNYKGPSLWTNIRWYLNGCG